MMDRDHLTLLMQLLSDPTRRSALKLLSGGEELCVCELMASLGATQSRMSRHMGALKEAGLVIDRRDAQWVRYRMAADIDPASSRIVDVVLAATLPVAHRRPAARVTAARLRSAAGHRERVA